jgi:hypothetical protein
VQDDRVKAKSNKRAREGTALANTAMNIKALVDAAPDYQVTFVVDVHAFDHVGERVAAQETVDDLDHIIVKYRRKGSRNVEEAQGGRGSTIGPGCDHRDSFEEQKVVQAKPLPHETSLPVVDKVRKEKSQSVIDAAHDDLVVNIAEGKWTQFFGG